MPTKTESIRKLFLSLSGVSLNLPRIQSPRLLVWLTLVACVIATNLVVVRKASAACHPSPYPVGISNAQSEASFSFTISSFLCETGAVIQRNGHYDYAPSVMKVNDSTVQMWWCGGGGSGISRGDSIFYSISYSYGQSGTWSTPVEVIRPSNNNAYLDYAHACDPSVTAYNGFYYIMYGGAPDWTPPPYADTNACIAILAPNGCDGRIFVARVPISQAGQPIAYQKLVNIGECLKPDCFQWQLFWNSVEYPPVPIIRNEIEAVWRRYGTGTQGYTIKQTPEYGIGQPSQVSVQALRIWFTRSFGDSPTDMRVWERPYADIENPYALQDNGSYSKRVSNVGNHVDYDIAYASVPFERYFVTVAAPANDSSGRPRVHAAHNYGWWVMPNPYHIISNNLATQGFLNAESNAHNSGFLRDQYGYLVTMAGHAGGPPYYWVYYGNNANLSPATWDINRVPFTISSP